MAQHKWHKEIKAWADGAEIEQKQSTMKQWVEFDGDWLLSDCWEYRIKPQPFLGMKEIPYKHWVLRFYKMPNDLWYTEGINDEWMNEMVEASKPQPKEPQYLYVYETGFNAIQLSLKDNLESYKCIGKIKLEVDDDTSPA